MSHSFGWALYTYYICGPVAQNFLLLYLKIFVRKLLFFLAPRDDNIRFVSIVCRGLFCLLHIVLSSVAEPELSATEFMF